MSEAVDTLATEEDELAGEENSEQDEVSAVTNEPINFDDPLEFPELNDAEKVALLQALLFAHAEPLTVTRLAQVARIKKAEVADLLESLQMNLEMEDSGVELCEIAGAYQLRTKEKFGPYLRQLRSGRPKKLSQQAFETLSIVAYRQPIVKSDVEKIRGVDATPTLKTLLDRRLIRIVGHKDTPGQPALYGTTDEFLKLFGLSSLSQLPTLRDLKELERDPGEEEAQGEEDAFDESEEVGDDAVQHLLEDSAEVGSVEPADEEEPELDSAIGG